MFYYRLIVVSAGFWHYSREQFRLVPLLAYDLVGESNRRSTRHPSTFRQYNNALTQLRLSGVGPVLLLAMSVARPLFASASLVIFWLSGTWPVLLHVMRMPRPNIELRCIPQWRRSPGNDRRLKSKYTVFFCFVYFLNLVTDPCSKYSHIDNVFSETSDARTLLVSSKLADRQSFS